MSTDEISDEISNETRSEIRNEASSETSNETSNETHTESAQRKKAARLDTLTGLRFPAALLVLLYHAALPFPEVRLFADDTAENRFTQLFGQAGALGVTFFFVLSGFVLTWSARTGDSAPSFWRRRFVKIVPNYVIAWALAMVLYAAAQTEAWREILSLLMVQVWVPDIATNLAVNPPGWSLAVEAVFYLSFPFLLRGAQRIRADRLKYWIAGTVAAVFATPLLTYALVPAGTEVMANEPSASATQYWFAYVMPLPRVLDFALGILVARAVMLGRWRNIGMVWSGVLLLVAYVIASNVPHLYAQRAVCLVPAALLIAAGAIADDEGRFTLFRGRAMVWLGEVSFAFYLLHYVVLAYTRKVLGDDLYSTPVGVAVLLAEIAVALLAAWALYALVEKPVTRRWSRSRASRRTST
ncbi:acyltransferase family protein [Streptomyces sp. NPDC050658]|uniref:acyltransferase family protein n=1 Tax=unclassified Streptomyces TaxID=2593676 RepID=UPI0034201DF5